MKRKSIVFILVFILLTAMGGQVLASGNAAMPAASVIGPLWVDVSQAGANLTFAGNLANCSAYVIGKAGTSRITGRAVLARRNANGSYTVVRTWNNLSASGSYLDFTGAHYVTTGYTYRLTFTATAYRNGASETITVYSSAYAG